MSRPSAFKQADVAKVLRAARAAGFEVTCVEVDPATGRINVVTGGGAAPAESPENTLLRRIRARKNPIRHQAD